MADIDCQNKGAQRSGVEKEFVAQRSEASLLTRTPRIDDRRHYALSAPGGRAEMASALRVAPPSRSHGPADDADPHSRPTSTSCFTACLVTAITRYWPGATAPTCPAAGEVVLAAKRTNAVPPTTIAPTIAKTSRQARRRHGDVGKGQRCVVAGNGGRRRE